MTDDEIERLLRELPASELPAAWRMEILRHARLATPTENRERRHWPPILLWLWHRLARNPISAGALAALWLLIFLFHATTPVDPQERELLAHADFTQPVRLINVSDEIRLVEIAEESPAPRPIP